MKLQFTLFILLIPIFSWSQIQITGTVLEKSSNIALVGATVLEKGTKTGTVTDFDGNFSLVVSDENSTLVFSYVGFIAQEVRLKGQRKVEIRLKESCNICWFDEQHIGFYLNSGVINNPIGGQFNFTFPSIFGIPILKSGISYQTNLKNNRFSNVHLNLHHLFVSCDFNADINSSYRKLEFENIIDLSRFSIESSLNFNKISTIVGFSTIDFSNIEKTKKVNSSGLIFGVRRWVGQPFMLFVSAKASIYKDLIEYEADIKKQYKGIYGFATFYKVSSFNEFSIGIGTEITYLFKN